MKEMLHLTVIPGGFAFVIKLLPVKVTIGLEYGL